MTEQIVPVRAYLGDKNLITHTVAPGTVYIDDWAYANCTNLKEIRIPVGCRVSGKAFAGCSNLAEINLYDGDEEAGINSYPGLLALAVKNRMSDIDMLISLASDDEAFLEYFDRKLLWYIDEPDDVGFSPFQAGGEEDYTDVEEDRKIYVRSIRQNKIILVYERLCSNGSVLPDMKKAYTVYLRRYNPDDTFLVLTESFGMLKAYRDLYFKLSLDKEVDAEKLLDMAGQDTMLRAMIIENRSEPANETGWEL